MIHGLSLSHILKSVAFGCLCLIFGLTFDSCGSSKNTVNGNRAERVDNSTDKSKTGPSKKYPEAGPGASHLLADALLNEARTWLGTPYKYGGETKDGADCSGFIMEVYRKVTGVRIPRNSGKQKEYCAEIDKKDLTVGDLVFFSSKRSGGAIAHVGMYVGDGRMIHASSSKGVTESPLDQNYWNRHYKGSGRIPLIAQLVPVPQPETPLEIPAPEKPMLADNNQPTTAPEVAYSVSRTNAPAVNDTKKNTDALMSSASGTSTVYQQEAQLAAVTVSSAFSDIASTRTPLTRKTKPKQARSHVESTAHRKGVTAYPDDVTPDVDKNGNDASEDIHAATPDDVVRNAFANTFAR